MRRGLLLSVDACLCDEPVPASCKSDSFSVGRMTTRKRMKNRWGAPRRECVRVGATTAFAWLSGLMQRAPPQSCILDPRRNGGASRVAEGPRARYGRARGARAHQVLRARRSRAHGSVGVGVSPSCVRRRSCRWRTCGVRHRESDIPARRRAPTTHGAGAHMIHMDRRNFCYAPLV